MTSMQDLLTTITDVVFDVERDLARQTGALLLPFRGMDKSGKAVCEFFNGTTGTGCDSMDLCPFRHLLGEKSVVCKHWLRGLCKKGDDCEFLHSYDLDKMPECFFFSKYNACNNKECPFRHVDPETRIKDCPWYDRGFCRHGPNCKSRHRRRALCIPYMNGFCVEGGGCKQQHPSFDLPQMEQMREDSHRLGARMSIRMITCHNCQQKGHKASFCPNPPSTAAILAAGPRQQMMGAPRSRHQIQQQQLNRQNQPRVPLSEITCYKCGEKGHFANRCLKSGNSFLQPR